jgi:hypothetical protein
VRKLVVLVVVAAFLTGVDVVAKNAAEGQIEKRARVEAGGSASAAADIKSFPFVGRLLVSGRAGDITVTLHDVTASALQFTTVRIALVDVKLDKAKLFKGKAEITHIDKGTITVGLSASDLSKQAHVPVTISKGKVFVTVAGRTLGAVPAVSAEGSLRLSVEGLPAVNLPIPRTRLISCPVSRVNVREGELLASCDITEVPPALLRAASRVVSGH